MTFIRFSSLVLLVAEVQLKPFTSLYMKRFHINIDTMQLIYIETM